MGEFINWVKSITGESSSKVSHAHHTARDDSGVRDEKDKEHFEKAPSWADKTTESGIPYFPEGKGPDGK